MMMLIVSAADTIFASSADADAGDLHTITPVLLILQVEDECGDIPMVLVQNKIDLISQSQIDQWVKMIIKSNKNGDADDLIFSCQQDVIILLSSDSRQSV